MKNRKRSKPYREMTARELHQATKEFDREFVAGSSLPLTPEMRRRWKKASRRLGRPRRGEGAKMVAITIERGLLRRVDAFARRKGINRSAAIAAGLEALLAAGK
jgi:hypothetical protein